MTITPEMTLAQKVRRMLDVHNESLKCSTCGSLRECEHTPEFDSGTDLVLANQALLAVLDKAAEWDAAGLAVNAETTMATVIVHVMTADELEG